MQVQGNHLCFGAIENEHMDCMISAQMFGNSLSKEHLCIFAAFMEKV